MQRHHIVYITTNLVNGKTYIGKHSQSESFGPHEFDGYLGSGKLLKLAIAKYGKDNFSRRTTFHSLDECKAFVAEKAAIEMLKPVYNILSGGHGASATDALLKVGIFSIDVQAKSNATARERKSGIYRADVQARNLAKLKQQKLGFYSPDVRAKGVAKAQSEEARQKRLDTLGRIGHQQGSKNSQYGLVWVTKDGQNKRVKKEELDAYQLLGWTNGRKLAPSKSKRKVVKARTGRKHSDESKTKMSEKTKDWVAEHRAVIVTDSLGNIFKFDSVLAAARALVGKIGRNSLNSLVSGKRECINGYTAALAQKFELDFQTPVS